MPFFTSSNKSELKYKFKPAPLYLLFVLTIVPSFSEGRRKIYYILLAALRILSHPSEKAAGVSVHNIHIYTHTLKWLLGAIFMRTHELHGVAAATCRYSPFLKYSRPRLPACSTFYVYTQCKCIIIISQE